jgi:hypothetical protein
VNSRHRRTLARIFAEPTPADLRWREIEGLLRTLGTEISEGAGSRVRVARKAGMMCSANNSIWRISSSDGIAPWSDCTWDF